MGDQSEYGHCEHGDYLLSEGCPFCLAEAEYRNERQAEEVKPASEQKEDWGCSTSEPDNAPPVPDNIFDQIPEKPEILPMEDEPEVKLSFSEAISTALAEYAPEKNIIIYRMKEEIGKALEYAKNREILSGDDVVSATNDLVLLTGLAHDIEGERTYYTKPLNDHLKTINAFFKEFSTYIAEADSITRDKIRAYDKQIKAQIAEAERIEEQRLQLAQDEMILQGEVITSLEPVEKPEPVPNHVRATMGTATKRVNWKWEVEDIKAVPADYLIPDAVKIGKVVRASAGAITIPGIRIYPEDNLTITRNKGGS